MKSQIHLICKKTKTLLKRKSKETKKIWQILSKLLKNKRNKSKTRILNLSPEKKKLRNLKLSSLKSRKRKMKLKIIILI